MLLPMSLVKVEMQQPAIQLMRVWTFSNPVLLKSRFGWEQSGSFASYAVSFLSLFSSELELLTV